MSVCLEGMVPIPCCWGTWHHFGHREVCVGRPHGLAGLHLFFWIPHCCVCWLCQHSCHMSSVYLASVKSLGQGKPTRSQERLGKQDRSLWLLASLGWATWSSAEWVKPRSALLYSTSAVPGLKEGLAVEGGDCRLCRAVTPEGTLALKQTPILSCWLCN